MKSKTTEIFFYRQRILKNFAKYFVISAVKLSDFQFFNQTIGIDVNSGDTGVDIWTNQLVEKLDIASRSATFNLIGTAIPFLWNKKTSRLLLKSGRVPYLFRIPLISADSSPVFI